MSTQHRAMILLALLVLGAPTSPGSALTVDGRVIHAGTLPADALSWHQEADGSWTVVFAGARPPEASAWPRLAESNLLLVSPDGRRAGGIEVVPLATRRVTAPGRLVAGRRAAGAPSPDLAASTAAWGEFGGNHTLRGVRLLGVRLFPVRAARGPDGAWSEVEVLDRYEIRVLPPASGGDAAPDLPVPADPVGQARLAACLAGVVANPEALAALPSVTAADERDAAAAQKDVVRGLVITREALAAQFQRLADYHSANGVPTVVRTVEWIEANSPAGRDLPETIRQYVQAAYAQWGLESLLLGGDTEVIPTRFVTSTYYPPAGTTEIPADLYYGCLDGNWDANGNGHFAEPYYSYLNRGDDADLAGELAVGRAPVRDAAEAAVFVDKTIAYLQPAPGARWLGRALLAAEVLFPSDYTPGATITLDGASFAQLIADNVLTPCTSQVITRLYEASQLWPGALRETRAAYRDTLNAGTHGVVFHIGHGGSADLRVGDATFTSADAAALHNGGHTFVMSAMTCSAAAFDSLCILEQLLRNTQGGAVAAVGSSRVAFTYTVANYQQEFARVLYCAPAATLGGALVQARLPQLPNTSYNTADRWMTLCYAVLGDPALVVWQDIPGPVATFLSGFSAEAAAGNVTLRWSVAQTPGEFRLTARQGDAAWSVSVTPAGGLSFVARDEAPRLAAGGRVAYTLEHRGSADEPWALLATREVELNAPARPVTLLEAHPNPFNPIVRVPFVLARSQSVRLTVHDLAGRRVATLADGMFAAGRQEVVWRGLNSAGAAVASGTYAIRIAGEFGRDTRKVTLVR